MTMEVEGKAILLGGYGLLLLPLDSHCLLPDGHL